MNPIVSMEWVRDRLDSNEMVIVDCRFVLGQPQAGRKAYEEEHLPRAFYLDLEKDLSGPIGKHGGRHPLPEKETFARTLSALGIDDSVSVVAYDDQGGAMAARLWWLLSFLGHPRTYVMDGSFTQWKANGYPVTSQKPTPSPRTFVPRPKPDWTADFTEVKQIIESGDAVLIDSREPKRYRGEEEPIDAIAGHIPGAKNFFWKDVLRPTGEWKSEEDLKRHFKNIPKDKEVIVYCGSGITATPNVLGLKKAGFPRVKLYPGSWSDWISHPEAPIARGDEPDQ